MLIVDGLEKILLVESEKLANVHENWHVLNEIKEPQYLVIRGIYGNKDSLNLKTYSAIQSNSNDVYISYVIHQLSKWDIKVRCYFDSSCYNICTIKERKILIG